MMRDTLRGLLLRLRHLVRRADFERQVQEEMSFHLQMEAEHRLAIDGSGGQAGREARLRFGGVDKHTEAMRSGRGADMLEHLVRDVRHSVRALRNSPAYSVTVIVTLMMGIGLNAMVFRVVSALLLQPLAVPQPERLLRVWTSESSASGGGSPYGAFSYPDFADLSSSAAPVTGLAAYVSGTVWETSGTEPRSIDGQFVSSSYFDVLRIGADRGRAFRQGEVDAVVIGHAYWHHAYGGRDDIIGSTLRLNGHPFTVVGVMPTSFLGTEAGLPADIFIPLESRLQLLPNDRMLFARGMRSLRVIGRLREGATLAATRDAYQWRMDELAVAYPETNSARRIEVTEAGPLLANGDGRVLFNAIGAAVLMLTLLVLTVACLNVVSLMLARAVARSREFAVRLALGASRRRLVSQLLVESELLALAAAGGALLLMHVISQLVASTPLGGRVPTGVDMRVAGFTVGLGAVTGLLLGALPAMRITRDGARLTLQEGATAVRPGRIRDRVVVVQLALSVFLLVGGAALGRSVARQVRVEPGFDPAGLLIMQPTKTLPGHTDERSRAFITTLVERLRSSPGIDAVAVANNAPLSGEGYRTSVTIVHADGGVSAAELFANHVGPDYFRAIGLPLLVGRELTSGSAPAQRSVVVTRALAEQYWPERNAVGQVMRVGGQELQVIAIARDLRFRSLNQAPVPMVFIQDPQNASETLHIRYRGDAVAAEALTRAYAEQLDAGILLFDLRGMDAVLRASVALQRYVAISVGVLGGLACVLACIGLYGLLVYGIVQGRASLGVRMALGATAVMLMRQLVRRSLLLLGVGCAAGALIGAAAAFGVSRVAPGTLALDPFAVLLPVVSLSAVGVLAAVLASRALARITPLSAMRVS